MELLDHMIVLFLVFLGNVIAVFHGGCASTHSYQQCIWKNYTVVGVCVCKGLSVLSGSFDPMGEKKPLPDSSVHGILKVRILECVAFPFSRGSSQPRD